MSHPALHTFADTVMSIRDVKIVGRARVYLIYCYNPSNVTLYLQLLPASSASATPVALGTTVPKYSFGIPTGKGITIQFPSGVEIGGDGLAIAGTTDFKNADCLRLDVNIAYS